jgi:serine/threonine protein kinase
MLVADPQIKHSGYVAKIIDFNVSKKFNVDGEVSQMMTKTGFLKYRAPELLADGPFGYSGNCDSWSYGGLLYFMLCGEHPYDNDE